METQTQATTINSMEQCWNLLGGAGWCLLGLTKNRNTAKLILILRYMNIFIIFQYILTSINDILVYILTYYIWNEVLHIKY